MKDKLMFGALVKDYDEASDFCRKEPTAAAGARAYLKCLRAAEMADWEMTVVMTCCLRSLRIDSTMEWREYAGKMLKLQEIFQDNQNVVFLQSPPTALDYSEEN